MLRTVKGQSLGLLSWKTFVSVSLYFPAIQRHPPTGLSLGSSQTPRLINGSWRCPVISSPNNKLQPKTGVPLRPTFNTAPLTTRRKPIIPALVFETAHIQVALRGYAVGFGHIIFVCGRGNTAQRESASHFYRIIRREEKSEGECHFCNGKTVSPPTNLNTNMTLKTEGLSLSYPNPRVTNTHNYDFSG